MVSAAAPGRSSGEGKDETGQDASPRPELEGAREVGEELRRLDLYVPTPDGDRDGPSSRLLPAVPGPWDAAVASLAADEVLPSFPAGPLTPAPDWAVASSPTIAALASQLPVNRQLDTSGRATADAPAFSVGEVVESPAETGDAAEAAPTLSPVPALSEQASDAVFLRSPRDGDRELAFLMAVAVGGFVLNPGTAAAAAGGGDLPGRRRHGAGRGS